jgi:hypothetical protein
MRQNKLYDKMSNRTDVWLTRTVNLATLVTGPVVFWAILALRYACVFTLHQAPRQKVLLLIAEVETESSECRLFPEEWPTSRLQQRSAPLIGYLGQALFPCLFWVFVTHPGHASLRSLV